VAFVLLRKGTRALNGNGIAFRQPVEKLARALPRCVSETGNLLVVRGLVADEDRQNVSSGAREWKLRRAPVLDALQYLITHSPPYMDPGNGVVIDEGRLTCIPEDGSVFDAVKVYMELGSYFLFLQEQIKDIIIFVNNKGQHFSNGGRRILFKSVQTAICLFQSALVIFVTYRMTG